MRALSLVSTDAIAPGDGLPEIQTLCATATGRLGEAKESLAA
jgi:hypothetical protein